jgi:hypothetical protein
MSRNLVYLVALSLLLSGCLIVEETERICDTRAAPAQAEAKRPTRLLRHVVLFQFTETASAEDIRRIENAFLALPGRIEAICDFEWGTDISVENRQKGFTHCFVVTFRNEADRGVYLPHPAHQELGAMLKPHLADVLVIDYWAN